MERDAASIIVNNIDQFLKANKWQKYYIYVDYFRLEESIDKEHWDPTGVPTIYKVINKLKHNNKKFKLILTVKDSYSKLQENKTKNIDIPGFLLPVTILKGTKHNRNFRLVKNIYREFTQFLNIVEFLTFNPH